MVNLKEKGYKSKKIYVKFSWREEGGKIYVLLDQIHSDYPEIEIMKADEETGLYDS